MLTIFEESSLVDNFRAYDTLRRDDDYLVELSSDIWLMDNHKWALWVWESLRQSSKINRFTLVHADYHWDGGYDFHGSPEMQEKLLVAGLDDLRNLIVEENWIRYDSFIAPAIKRGMFDEVHFFCKQNDGFDIGIGDALLEQCGTRQIFHEAAATLAAAKFPSPVIFDLCLDLFNRSTIWNKGDLWEEVEILEFLEIVRPVIERAILVTVSLSFECSGTAEDTKRLAQMVLPVIENWRGVK
jgi:UPF0489 domain